MFSFTLLTCHIMGTNNKKTTMFLTIRSFSDGKQKRTIAFFLIIEENETPITEFLRDETFPMSLLHRVIYHQDIHAKQRIFIQQHLKEKYPDDFPGSQLPIQQIQDTQQNDENLQSDATEFRKKKINTIPPKNRKKSSSSGSDNSYSPPSSDDDDDS
jgi:hypothetical protein